MRSATGFCLAVLLSASAGVSSLATNSPPLVKTSDGGMEDAIRKVPALQGQVNVLEQLDQEVVQSRENHLPLLNGVAVSDATSVVLPEKGSKLETKIFSIGARDVGWIGFFKGTHVQTPAFADGAKILLSSL